MNLQTPAADKGDVDADAASLASTTACVLDPPVRTPYYLLPRTTHENA
jgi:hypothetical protein